MAKKKKVEMSEFITDKDGNFVTLEREEQLIEIIRKRGGNTLLSPPVEAKNGFYGVVKKPTQFKVGEKGKKELVKVKDFDFGGGLF